MANAKISALTALTGANVEQTADSLAIVDASVTTTKKILVSELAKALQVLATEQASTSGASITFSSIPAWVKKITVQFVGVSTNGTSNWLIQIGDSGGVEATGYLGASTDTTNSTAVTGANYTTGFGLRLANASNVMHGSVTLTLEDSANNTWVASGVLAASNSATCVLIAGSKALSATLDQVVITTVNGTDAFDAGAINILYE